MITGIEVPLELATLLCAACIAAGAWAGHIRANRRLDPRLNPLRDLMKAENLAEAVDLAARRNARRAVSHAVLHGRIDQLAAFRSVWNADTNNQVREHVAAVMRAGLRRGDSMALAEGEGFTIIIPGADERSAVHVADRLRRSLANLRLPHLGSDARLTASFGVAADRFGDSDFGLNTRARRALDAALAKGMDHIVPASEIEEVMLLPAPTPSHVASAA
ncbi:GGDEF domain-containing protein [Porphyrobacter sp. ULC335]|uniref:GGDEF domain-containing protein n=1 Tax=Porphyrobacter sp. ULC335 TaxID=2854260 RepID=UPI002220822F|nr:diguanylate cyclase [Porphyrobacter sp. ULC335]UYV14363.1 diguanylate cyclase [Porphyrobacter sp. ULC335]